MPSIIKQFILFSVLASLLTLNGCDDKHAKDTPAASQHIRVGAIVGSELNILEVVAKIAKEKYNLDVTIVEFTDYSTPNDALNRGDIDINAFQHKPFLDEQVKTRHYDIVPVANTFIYPMAAYSKKIKNSDEIKEGDTVAIPNDPTNSSRSLLLLEKEGLLKLKPGTGYNPTTLDIIENPKNLRILELEAPQLPRALDDSQVTFAIINTAYSSQIGLIPTKDGIFVEDNDSPYVNIIAARRDNQHDENVQTFIKAFQNDEVAKAAEIEFKGSLVKGW